MKNLRKWEKQRKLKNESKRNLCKFFLRKQKAKEIGEDSKLKRKMLQLQNFKYISINYYLLSLQVFHAPSIQQATQFEFRIRYKFLSRTEAVVRYGPNSELLELGKVTPGTYCTRQFEECYRSKCRLQSPNYPGMVRMLFENKLQINSVWIFEVVALHFNKSLESLQSLKQTNSIIPQIV